MCLLIMHVQGILSDLFPGITLPEHDYGKLQSGIIETMEKHGLQVQGHYACMHTHKTDVNACTCLYSLLQQWSAK